MSDAYEEIVQGETIRRLAPGPRHEAVCARLHERMAMSLARLATIRLLPPRCIVALAPGTLLRPDLALVTAATGKPWLLAEVVDSADHRMDTVVKKSLYEDLRLPRLWILDPRYDNVEVYHGTAYGLALKQTLAGRDVLMEAALPDFQCSAQALFSEVA
jgi:hypothetical protein